MIYLAFIVLLAGGGILKLWLYQRRQNDLGGVDEFWAGLEKVAAQPAPAPRRALDTSEGRPRPMARPQSARTGARPAPLDPARRAAAKMRIEARRRAMSGGTAR